MACSFSPLESTERIVETIKYQSTRVDRAVVESIVGDFSDKNPFPSLVLGARARKGKIVDSLVVRIDDKASRTLSYADCQGVTLAVIQTHLLALTSLTVPARPNLTWTPPPDLLDLWDSILTGICSSAPVVDREFLSYVDHLVERLSSDYGVSAALAREFRRILVDLSSTYLIWCPVSAGLTTNSIRLQIEFSSARTSLSDLQFFEKLRIRVGMQPRTAAFALPLATESRSYHGQVEVPNGLYLYDSEVAVLERGYPQLDPNSLQMDSVSKAWLWKRRA